MKHFILILTMTLLSGSLLAQIGEPENLGTNVNTEYSEVAPVISPDGKTLFFARKGHPDNLGVMKYYDIWYSELQSDNTWSQAKNIGAPLNNEYSNDIQAISADGSTILIKGYYNEGTYETGKGYSFAQKSGSNWDFPKGIDIEGYEDMVKGAYSSATMSTNQRVIILAFSEEAESKVDDLYVTQKQSNGSWSKPQYITSLNKSDYTETAPFLAADDKTLYFSSNRPGGLGKNDIYITRRLDDTWTNWSEPENIGEPINTSAWDAYYAMPASAEFAYTVSSNNSIGQADIFQVKLQDDFKPDAVVMIYGKVYNGKTEIPMSADVQYNQATTGSELGNISTQPSGEYKIFLPYGQKYTYSPNKTGYIASEEVIDLTEVYSYQEIEQDLYLFPLEAGVKVKLENIFFKKGKSDLLEESYPELNHLYTVMRSNPTLRIQLNGHTDINGSDRALNELSRRRVVAVRGYLVNKGISEDRIETKAFGKTQPITTDPDEQEKNRRVEVEVLAI